MNIDDILEKLYPYPSEDELDRREFCVICGKKEVAKCKKCGYGICTWHNFIGDGYCNMCRVLDDEV